MNKLVVWGTVFLIVSVIIFPITYFIFSFWWLITGDMVSRLTYFSTGFITIISLLLIFALFSFKKRILYKDSTDHVEKVKKIYKKLLNH